MFKPAREVRQAQDRYSETVWKLPHDLQKELGGFNAFIGDVPTYYYNIRKHEVTDEASQRIDMLNSPHAETILRVHAIRLRDDREAVFKRRHHKK